MTGPTNTTTQPSQSQPTNRAEKSSLAYRTISEVARELDVAAHVLRFWETKFSQILPLKRGGGRRYYSPEDVDLIRKIKTMLYDEGYTIRGVQAYLDNGGSITATTATVQQDRGEARKTTAVLSELRQIRAILD